MAPPAMRRPRAREGEVSPAGKLLLVFVVAATIVYVAFGGGGSREPIDRATATAAAAATARGEARLADASLAKNLGTRETQLELRWCVDRDIATRICAKNRAFAEPSGYWVSGTTFLDDEATTLQHAVTFHDSATGLPLFVAPRVRRVRSILASFGFRKNFGFPRRPRCPLFPPPRPVPVRPRRRDLHPHPHPHPHPRDRPQGRTWREFEAESRAHGWPSFRDEEVVWENVRVLGRENNAEVISADGVTHLVRSGSHWSPYDRVGVVNAYP